MTNADTLPSTLATAMDAHQSGNLDAARSAYEAVLLAHPDHHEARHLIAIVCGQMGDAAACLHHIDQALALHPTEPTYHITQGNARRRLKQFDAAWLSYEKALSLAPRNPVIYNNTGLWFSAQGRWQEAREQWHKALALQPDYTEACFNLALADRHLGHWDDARTALTTVLRQQPEHVQAWLTLGQICHEQDKLGDALHAYQHVLKHSAPHHHGEVHHLIGCVLLAQEQPENALAHWHRVLDEHPDHTETHHNMATLYLRQHQPQKALPHALRAAHANNDAESHFQAGMAYYDQQRWQEARAHFDQALQHDNDHVPSMVNCAAIALKQKDPEQACTWYERVLALEPNHEHARYLHAALKRSDHVPTRAPQGYVRDLFDDYADHFDQHLQGQLDYHIPDQIRAFLLAHWPERLPLAHLMDIGCGTGLCGQALSDLCSRIDGVDLSRRMLDKAHEKGCYDQLHEQDALDCLHEHPAGYDALVLGDCLPYLGDLQPLIAACTKAAKPQALWLASFEISESVGYHLHHSARYAHHIDYVRDCLNSHGWVVQHELKVIGRQQAGQPVASMIIGAQRCL